MIRNANHPLTYVVLKTDTSHHESPHVLMTRPRAEFRHRVANRSAQDISVEILERSRSSPSSSLVQVRLTGLHQVLQDGVLVEELERVVSES